MSMIMRCLHRAHCAVVEKRIGAGFNENCWPVVFVGCKWVGLWCARVFVCAWPQRNCPGGGTFRRKGKESTGPGLARAGHVPAIMVVWGCGQSMGGVGGWAMPQGDTCCHFGPKCPPTLCPCLRKVWAGKLLANWVPPHVLAVPVIYPWAGKSLAMFWPLRNNSSRHGPHGGVGVRPKCGRYGRVGSAPR